MSVLSRAERQYARAVKNAMLGRNIRAGRQLRSTDALLNMADLLGQKREDNAVADAGVTGAATGVDTGVAESERTGRRERQEREGRSSRPTRSRRKRIAEIDEELRAGAARDAFEALSAAKRRDAEREASEIEAREEADAISAIQNLDTELGRDLSISPEVYGGQLANILETSPGKYDIDGVPTESMLNYLLNPNVAGAYRNPDFADYDVDDLPYSFFESEVPGRQVARLDDGDFKGYVNDQTLLENIAALGDPDDFNRLLEARPDVKIPQGFTDITEESLSQAEAAQRAEVEAEEAEYRDIVENISNLDTESGENAPEDPVYSDDDARAAQAALNADESDREARRVLLGYRAERGDRDALELLRSLVTTPRRMPTLSIPRANTQLPSFIPNI